MKESIHILAVLGSSLVFLIFQGCGSMNRADTDRMLDRRADYNEGPEKAIVDAHLKEAGVDGFKNSPVPVRTRPKVAALWIHPHETATRDYFWGGWISVVVEQDQWVMSRPELVPAAKGFDELPIRSVQPPPPPLMPSITKHEREIRDTR